MERPPPQEQDSAPILPSIAYDRYESFTAEHVAELLERKKDRRYERDTPIPTTPEMLKHRRKFAQIAMKDLKSLLKEDMDGKKLMACRAAIPKAAYWGTEAMHYRRLLAEKQNNARPESDNTQNMDYGIKPEDELAPSIRDSITDANYWRIEAMHYLLYLTLGNDIVGTQAQETHSPLVVGHMDPKFRDSIADPQYWYTEDLHLDDVIHDLGVKRRAAAKRRKTQLSKETAALKQETMRSAMGDTLVSSRLRDRKHEIAKCEAGKGSKNKETSIIKR